MDQAPHYFVVSQEYNFDIDEDDSVNISAPSKVLRIHIVVNAGEVESCRDGLICFPGERGSKSSKQIEMRGIKM